MRRLSLALALLAALGSGCVRRGSAPVVHLFASGDESLGRAVRSLASAQGPLAEVRATEGVLPAPSPAYDPEPLERSLALARRAAAEADFTACLEHVREDAAWVRALDAGRRDLAARALTWRLSCFSGGGDAEAALREARTLASVGLERAAELQLTPEADALLERARRELASAPPARVTVRTEAPSRGRPVLDGVPRPCSLPCAELALSPGPHVLGVEAEGALAEPELVLVPAGAGTLHALQLRTRAATPPEAARQWAQRYLATPAALSPESVALLARSLSARRLVLVSAERDPLGPDALLLRAAFALDGGLRTTASRRTTRARLALATGEVVRDALQRGGVVSPPAWASPFLWTALGVVTVAAGVAGYAGWALQPRRIEVGFLGAGGHP